MQKLSVEFNLVVWDILMKLPNLTLPSIHIIMCMKHWWTSTMLTFARLPKICLSTKLKHCDISHHLYVNVL